MERGLSVEIIPVDDDEGLVDHFTGHQDSVGGSPGFLPFGIEGESFGDLVQFLGDEDELERFAVNRPDTGVLFLDGGFHGFTERLADDIDDFSESRFDGIVDRIIDNGFTIGAEAVHLLEASIAAAHSGCKDKKCRFHENLGFNYILCHANLVILRQ